MNPGREIRQPVKLTCMKPGHLQENNDKNGLVRANAEKEDLESLA